MSNKRRVDGKLSFLFDALISKQHIELLAPHINCVERALGNSCVIPMFATVTKIVQIVAHKENK